MKKILFTSTYFYPYLSGLAEYPLKLASHFSKNYQVTVLTFQHQNDLEKVEQLNSLTVHRVPVHLKVFKGLWNFFYPFTVLKQVIRNDVIFINLPQFEGLFPSLLGRIFGKKTYCIYNCELSFENNFPAETVAFLGNLSAYFSCLFCDKIITYTKNYAQNSSILKYFPKKLFFVLPPVEKYTIDKSYSKYLKDNFSTFKPIIGFAGRVAREKGLVYLIEALIMLEKDFPDISLLVAGPYGKNVVGEENYYLKIARIVKSKKLKVYFLGSLDKNRLFSFYKKIDLLVLPSVNKTEAFGMVQVDAMLSGTPVIASDIPGVRVPINLTKMGLLVKPGSSKDLANKIIKILQNPKKFRENTKKAKIIFNAKKTYKFYEKLII